MVVLFIQILNKKKKDDAAFSLRTSKKVSYLLFAGQSIRDTELIKGFTKDGRYGNVEQIEFIKGSSAYNNQFESSLKQIINNRRK